MANFDAQVRTSYRDVGGLVLSCTRDGIIEDVDNPGFVKEWRNDAPGLPSKPTIRNPGDPDPTYLGGRFGNPRQLEQALQPTLDTSGGNQRCQFDRSRSTFLQTDLLVADLPDSATPQPMACGYQFEKGVDVSNGQVIFDGTGGELKLFRRDGAGDAVVNNNGSLTTVGGDHDDGTFVYTGQAAGTSLWQKDGGAYGAGVATTTTYANADRLFIGSNDSAGDFLDGTLDSIHLWTNELSPRTIDLIWQSINEDGTDFSSSLRAPMSVPNAIWTDITGILALDQVNRLHPLTGVPFRFIKVSLPASPAPHIIQVGATVDGLVLPDAQLGGAEFVYNFVEIPGPPFITPTISQDAGWSAVADFSLNQEGHYTLQISRIDAGDPQNNGGSIIVHFDVEVGT